MRYRPFARTGMAVSAVSLALDGVGDQWSPSNWRDLIHAAFEQGVNAFELIRPSPALLAGFADGVQAVKRSLLFVSFRAEPQYEGEELIARVEEVIGQAAIGELNLLTVQAEAAQAEAVIGGMYILKDRELVQRLGVAGDAEHLVGPVESGLFDALITPFNLLSGWRDRNLVRTALERQLGVVAADPCPEALGGLVETAVAESKPGLFQRRQALAGAGTYAFLSATPRWSAEQICIAYALTEPAVATVRVEVGGPDHLAALAEVADRDLPSAVSAQIEMARFSAERNAQRRSA